MTPDSSNCSSSRVQSEPGKALITGGSGYFGLTLVDELLNQNYECWVYDRFRAPALPQKARFIKGDIRDPDKLGNCIREIDIVFHLAAVVPLNATTDNLKSINVNGTENVLRLSSQYNVEKVVFCSSSAVFGVPSSNPVTEADDPSPFEPYGRSKLKAERECRNYSEEGLDVTIIRPRTILGPERMGIISLLFEWIKRNRSIPIPGGGDFRYQLIDSTDLARAFILAAEESGSQCYHCGAEEFSMFKEEFSKLCQYADSNSKILAWPEKLTRLILKSLSKSKLVPLKKYHAEMIGRSFYFDNTKLKRRLGWNSKYNNLRILKRSWDSFIKNQPKHHTSEFSHRSPVTSKLLTFLGDWFFKQT